MYSQNNGGISWIDLTVKDAGQSRDFYQSVVGLKSEALSMGDYDDYVMSSPENDENQVGVCHARGVNADLPAQWLIYFNVDDIDQSLKQCVALGGEIIRDKRDMGSYHMAVIKDPAGAVVSLVEKAK